MEEETALRHAANEVRELDVWLGAALAIGRDHLGLSLKDACRELAGVSDKTLMKWESGERLHPLAYAIALARRDEVTRSMLLQALSKDTSQS
jgi:transcriptional regulator with XRE-family HTH domain